MRGGEPKHCYERAVCRYRHTADGVTLGCRSIDIGCPVGTERQGDVGRVVVVVVVVVVAVRAT